jgi:biotin operon repressor
MSRPQRLFRLLDALRRLPSPVTAAQLSHDTGVSVRSVYRDIETLRAGGAEIGGERGFGYTLVDDGTLRPHTFSRIEIEALTLGLAEVRQMGDPALASAANAVLAKVAATLPSLGQQHLLHAVSQVHRFGQRFSSLPDMATIRACWYAGHCVSRWDAGRAGALLPARGLSHVPRRAHRGARASGRQFPAAAGSVVARLPGDSRRDVTARIPYDGDLSSLTRRHP